MKRQKHIDYASPVESRFATDFRNLIEFAWLQGWDAAAERYRSTGMVVEDWNRHCHDRSASLDKFIRNHADALIAKVT